MRMTQLGAGWTQSPRPVLRGRAAALQRRSSSLLTRPADIVRPCRAHKSDPHASWDGPDFGENFGENFGECDFRRAFGFISGAEERERIKYNVSVDTA